MDKLTVDIDALTHNFNRKMDESVGKLKSTAEQHKQFGERMMVVTGAILVAGGAAIKYASDLSESMNKAEVTFGQNSEAVKAFAKNSLTSFGVAQGSALDMAAKFGDMATSMGINQQQAAGMSTKLVGLAADLSSFKNIKLDVANTALTSIFTGETESLKTLGIVMTEANLKTFALAQGMKKSYDEMSEGEKVALRYGFVMEKTKNAQGDFARTGGGAANQMRIFQESLKELASSFGELILPSFTKVVTLANKLIQSFSDLDPATKKVIIVGAGLIAVVGPLVAGLGVLVNTVIPTLITGFTALTGPIGLVSIAIAALTALWIDYEITANRVSNTLKSVAAIEKEARESVRKEANAVNDLVKSINSNTTSLEDKKKAILELKKISPEYFTGLDTERIGYNKVNEAAAKYISNLEKIGKAKVLQSQLDASFRLESEILKDPESATPWVDKILTKLLGEKGDFEKKVKHTADWQIGKIKFFRELIEKDLADLAKEGITPESYANMNLGSVFNFKDITGSKILSKEEAVKLAKEAFKIAQEAFASVANKPIEFTDSLFGQLLKSKSGDKNPLSKYKEEFNQTIREAFPSQQEYDDIVGQVLGGVDFGAPLQKKFDSIKIKVNPINWVSNAELQGQKINEYFGDLGQLLEATALGRKAFLKIKEKINNMVVNGLSIDEAMAIAKENLQKAISFWTPLFTNTINFLADTIALGLESLFSKDVDFDFGKQFKKLLGGLLTSLGDFIIQYAIKMEIVQSAMAAIAATLGTPAGWGAVAALLGIGIALKGAGSAIANSGNKGGTNSQLSSPSIGGKGAPSYGANMRSSPLQVNFQIQGTNLIGVLQNTNQAYGL